MSGFSTPIPLVTARIPADCRARIRGIEVVAIHEELSFGVDAVVIEQDTARVLAFPQAIVEPASSPQELVREMVEEVRPAPGTVLVEDTYPLRLHAIVHDLDRNPSWREEWVVRALDGIRAEMLARHLSTLVLPMLAVRHGTMEPARFMSLLSNWLQGPVAVQGIYLALAPGVTCAVLAALAGQDAGPSPPSAT